MDLSQHAGVFQVVDSGADVRRRIYHAGAENGAKGLAGAEGWTRPKARRTSARRASSGSESSEWWCDADRPTLATSRVPHPTPPCGTKVGMAAIHVSAEGPVSAPPDAVYRYLTDMRTHHPKFLPPAFSDFRVESGGVGAGTIIAYTLTAGGRTRAYRAQVAEPEPGRTLTESDINSSAVTTFTVTPDGAASRVKIDTTWRGASGIGGFFERRFAPRVLRSIYEEELRRLDTYARQRPDTG